MTEQEQDGPWFTDHSNLVLLTAWMAEDGTYDADDVARAVEKPWDYGREFVQAVLAQDEDSEQSEEDVKAQYGILY